MGKSDPQDVSHETQTDIASSPEFQERLRLEVAAIQSKIAVDMEALRDEFARLSAPAQAAPIEGNVTKLLMEQMEPLFRQMAMSIADVSNVGRGGPKAIAPEVLVRREESRQKMGAAIMKCRAKIKELYGLGKKQAALLATPRYRVIAKTCLNENFIEPFYMDNATRRPLSREIYWTGPPNPAMRPLNEPALEIFNHFRDWVGGVDPSVAKEAWVTDRGRIMVIGASSRPPVSAMMHNKVTPDIGDFDLNADEQQDDGKREDTFFEDQLAVADGEGRFNGTDPRQKSMHVLGTLAPPAVVGSPNDVVRRSF